MAINESYNFDDGTFQGWAEVETGNLTTSVTAEAALNGSSFGVEYNAVTQSGDGATITKTLGTTYSDIYYRFFLKTNSAYNGQFDSTVDMINFAQSSIFNSRGKIQLLEASGVLTLRDSLGSNTFVFSTNTEYDVQIRFLRHATTGGFQVWINGNLEIDDLNYNTDTSDIGFIAAGLEQAIGQLESGSKLYLDEFQIADAFIESSVSVSPNNLILSSIILEQTKATPTIIANDLILSSIILESPIVLGVVSPDNLILSAIILEQAAIGGTVSPNDLILSAIILESPGVSGIISPDDLVLSSIILEQATIIPSVVPDNLVLSAIILEQTKQSGEIAGPISTSISLSRSNILMNLSKPDISIALKKSNISMELNT